MNDLPTVGAEKLSHCGESYTTKKFNEVSMTNAIIGGRAGKWVNAIELNNEVFGGGGSSASDSLILAKGEYISYIKVSWWRGLYAFITEIKIETTLKNKNRQWMLAGSENQKDTLEPTYVRAFGESKFNDKANEFDRANIIVQSENKQPIRVVGLAGYYRGDALESIDIRYLDPYSPPVDEQVVDLDTDLFGIFDVYLEGTRIQTTDNESYRRLEALKLTHEITVSAETEIKAQYMMAEATARFSLGYMNRQELDSQIETTRDKSVMTESTIGKDKVGLLCARLEIRKNKDGSYLLVPIDGASVMPVDIQRLKKLSFIDFRKRLQLATVDIDTVKKYGFDGFHHAET